MKSAHPSLPIIIVTDYSEECTENNNNIFPSLQSTPSFGAYQNFSANSSSESYPLSPNDSYSFIQLAGHSDNFRPGEKLGLVMKKSSESEAFLLSKLVSDPLRPFVPAISRSLMINGERFVEMTDLLYEFDNANVNIMDCKMGVRTFQEVELLRASFPRNDLYKKMVAEDPSEPTEEENAAKAISKSRYLQWRDAASSSVSFGFRIEGIKPKNGPSKKDFKSTRSKEQISAIFGEFIAHNSKTGTQYIHRLEQLKHTLSKSHFFSSHELIGSSLLFVHDDEKASVFLIDFGKTTPVDRSIVLTHKDPWVQGNHEDGYLIGLTNMISIWRSVVFDHDQGIDICDRIISPQPETSLQIPAHTAAVNIKSQNKKRFSLMAVMNDPDFHPSADALSSAIYSGKVHMVRFILDASECDSDPDEEKTHPDLLNGKDSTGRTALINACLVHDNLIRCRIVSILIERGADLNMTDNLGRTALSYVCEKRYNDTLQQLIATSHLNPNIADERGNTPLMHCAISGNNIGIEHLIRCFRKLGGLNVNQQNIKGQTAVILAAKHANLKCALTLVEKGRAHVTNHDRGSGLTAEDYARNAGYSTPDIYPLIPRHKQTATMFRASNYSSRSPCRRQQTQSTQSSRQSASGYRTLFKSVTRRGLLMNRLSVRLSQQTVTLEANAHKLNKTPPRRNAITQTSKQWRQLTYINRQKKNNVAPSQNTRKRSITVSRTYEETPKTQVAPSLESVLSINKTSNISTVEPLPPIGSVKSETNNELSKRFEEVVAF